MSVRKIKSISASSEPARTCGTGIDPRIQPDKPPC